MGRALRTPERYKAELEEAIVTKYHTDLRGERFLHDPTRDGTLLVDGDNEIISLLGVDFGKGSDGFDWIKSFNSYDVLTGPNKGKNFGSSERPLPAPYVPPKFFKEA